MRTTLTTLTTLAVAVATSGALAAADPAPIVATTIIAHGTSEPSNVRLILVDNEWSSFDNAVDRVELWTHDDGDDRGILFHVKWTPHDGTERTNVATGRLVHGATYVVHKDADPRLTLTIE